MYMSRSKRGHKRLRVSSISSRLDVILTLGSLAQPWSCETVESWKPVTRSSISDVNGTVQNQGTFSSGPLDGTIIDTRQSCETAGCAQVN